MRKSAEYCGISLPTAFYWRHKLLDIVKVYVQRIKLNKLIEVDDTYFSYSEKGKTPKDRPAKKRGEPAQKRGLSKDKVSVTCAIDREGKLYSKVATRGRPNSSILKRVLKKHISSTAILVTDCDSAYRTFAKDVGINIVQVKAKTTQGIFHVQTVNSYHSKLKFFISRFKGVATKYLDNYLAWHNLIVERKTAFSKILKNLIKCRLDQCWHDVADKPSMPLPA